MAAMAGVAAVLFVPVDPGLITLIEKRLGGRNQRFEKDLVICWECFLDVILSN